MEIDRVPSGLMDGDDLHLFETVKSLITSGDAVDLTTVTHRSKDLGNALTPSFVMNFFPTMLDSKWVNPVSWTSHLALYQRWVVQQRIAEVAREMQFDSFDDLPPEELLQKTQAALSSLTGGMVDDAVSMSQNARESFIESRKASVEKGKLKGLDCGFPGVNAVTGGLQKTNLVVIAARPGMGKTALVMDLIVTLCFAGYRVHVISLEMSRIELTNRLYCKLANVDYQRFVQGLLMPHEEVRVANAAVVLEKWQVQIDEDCVQLERAKGAIRRAKADVSMIDYLQLMEVAGVTNREQQISTISRNLKAIAKSEDIPVVALSQLSRKVEDRPDKRPQLSDLRESGAIEQDANVVWFLFRPEYYGISVWDDDEGLPTDGEAEFMIAKNRNGGIDNVRVRWDAPTMSFSPL